MEESKQQKSLVLTSAKTITIVAVAVIALCAVVLGISNVSPKIKERIENWKSSFLDVKEVKDTVKVTSEESTIINVVEKAQDSVVSIALSKLELKEGKGVVDVSDKIGTGFVVDKSGLIITNQHVVSIANQAYKVVTSAGKSYDVESITIDDSNDIALLKVKADDELKPLKLGDSANLKVGQLVVAIGTPLGEYAGSVTSGIISGLNRSVTTSSGSFWSQTSKQYEDVIQTDAAINPGNSGGPLLNSSGEVIGVNFATTSGADNISFALPANKVTQRLDEYRKYGKFIRPYMGVEYRMISKLEEQYYKNVKAGALIMRITASSPASKSGLKKADIITKFAGQDVDRALSTLISEQKVGDEVKMEVYRNGKTIELTVKLEEAN